MTGRVVRTIEGVPRELRAGLQRLREELGITSPFSPDVLAAADTAVVGARMPEVDLTGIEFVTIDPPGAQDLDQAVHIARAGAGYAVSYAIADVAAFVAPGGPIDVEAHRRGQTFYAPSAKAPLHPASLSEHAASLLPGQVRPALVWRIELDSDGALQHARLERALVRSREQLTYDVAQARLDGGTASPSLALVREVGLLREAREVARGGVSLPLPEQEIHVIGERWELVYRSPLPVEGWNAQISLLAGSAAAGLMLDARVGILRTLPPADADAVGRLRRTAQALSIDWPDAQPYPEFVRTLNPATPRHAAMLNACTLLFRGAGYHAFRGTAPAESGHAALAMPYAHTTAPLRRLVDRYSLEVCVHVSEGDDVPEWVCAALPEIPDQMRSSDARAKKYERGIIDLTEALVLSPEIGRTFAGTLVDVAESRGVGTIQIASPAVSARVRGESLELGTLVDAQLVTADVSRGRVEFRV